MGLCGCSPGVRRCHGDPRLCYETPLGLSVPAELFGPAAPLKFRWENALQRCLKGRDKWHLDLIRPATMTMRRPVGAWRIL